MIALLSEVLTELQGLRTDFNEFTGYNVYRLSEVVDLIGDRICGGVSGVGGDSLSDIGTKLDAIDGTLLMIDTNTSA
jgi:hypothetical protein